MFGNIKFLINRDTGHIYHATEGLMRCELMRPAMPQEIAAAGFKGETIVQNVQPMTPKSVQNVAAPPQGAMASDQPMHGMADMSDFGAAADLPGAVPANEQAAVDPNRALMAESTDPNAEIIANAEGADKIAKEIEAMRDSVRRMNRAEVCQAAKEGCGLPVDGRYVSGKWPIDNLRAKVAEHFEKKIMDGTD